MPTDTRPRYPYRLPDGRIVKVIHDYNEQPKPQITYGTGGAFVVVATLVSESELAGYSAQQMADCARLIIGSARCGKAPRDVDAIALAKMVLGIPGALPKESCSHLADSEMPFDDIAGGGERCPRCNRYVVDEPGALAERAFKRAENDGSWDR